MPEAMSLSGERIFDDVRATLSELGIDPERIRPDARLVDDLELDSLDWIDLAMRLEERLPVALQERRLAEVHTLAEVVAEIEAQLDGRAES
jgi:acyl carrier protein